MKSGRAALLIILALGVLVAPVAAKAQQTGKIWRICFLSPYSTEYDKSWRAAFQQGLRDLGYVPGKNVVIDQRHADGRLERLPELARGLVALKPDVCVVHGFPQAIRAVSEASSTIPIVMVANPDPVGGGFAASLARPGGNVTGVSDAHSDLVGKRLALLKEVVPSAARIGVLINPENPAQQSQFKAMRTDASPLRLTVFPVEVRGPDDFTRAFTTIERERLDALTVLGGAAGIHGKELAALALKNRTPTIVTVKEAAAAGFLMSYGANFLDLYSRAATYVDKILKGAKPSDLPIEQPTKFDLAINLKTAKALGITIPRSLLLRADQVIE